MRENLLYASMLGGIAIAQTGTTAVHAMGYPLTFYDDMEHGKANALLLAEYLKFVEKKEKINVNLILTTSGFQTINQLQDMILSLIKEIPIVPEKALKEYAMNVVSAKSVTNTNPKPNENDIFTIYKNSLARKRQ